MLVSLFNDVVGPVMRGPSSSHCAAALRIGRLARDLLGGEVASVEVTLDRFGSLATTFLSQGSEMGLCGGLLGWEATDPRLPLAARQLAADRIVLEMRVEELRDAHPNTYRLRLRGPRREATMVALSTGGGAIQVNAIDDTPVSLHGDRLVRLRRDDGGWVEVEGIGLGGAELVELRPVLPVATRPGIELPFRTCAELLAHDAERRRPLWQQAVDYEAERAGIGADEVIERMVGLVQIVRGSIAEGIAGTEYADRILPAQTPAFERLRRAGGLLEGGILNPVLVAVSALMEVKSSMGVILAAPTAGACAAFPAAAVAGADALGRDDQAAARAMLAGGAIGLLIANSSTFAAEEGGCQAEGGSAGGMAAAAFAELGGASLGQSLAAASMALQSSLGLICDPVANRVEVPCLGKNLLAASNAFACANLALAGGDEVIPLDEVIETMDRVGRSLPRELRCTALGGLSTTPTSMEIEGRLCGGCS
ncbi:MAG: L-serine ammonia-lyase, iron-sulfur-dependent, subunit alpha [Planctomycetes bacterium]|nr:L-serine ammonia-lyase, iron-sulfur-dependent, subunit alpha [Planctomycetota bacterium]MBL7008893.1 L-serine ammonia-lyase, iron-sulfur-dependent, subunit alpha [Planctomycetota bacterium]